MGAFRSRCISSRRRSIRNHGSSAAAEKIQRKCDKKGRTTGGLPIREWVFLRKTKYQKNQLVDF
jgi:hypothetical protein